MVGEVAGVASMTLEQLKSQIKRDASLLFQTAYNSRITGYLILVY